VWSKMKDPFLLYILLSALVGFLLPTSGAATDVLDWATKIAIFLLFLGYGARLSTAEAWAGLKHWRLHLTILAFTFVVFPLIGIALRPATAVLSSDIYLGILYLTLVPSTVQSSVAFTSVARGNVAGAIVSASASNLVGVVATPALVMLLMSSGSGIKIDSSVFADIAIQLLLPFIIGQLARRWVKETASAQWTKTVDRGSIAMVVYSAFSAGIVAGIWHQVSIIDVIILTAFSIILVALMLWLTRFIALRCGFNREDMIAIQFCGTKKSLATGLPMAAVIFGSSNVGLLILPLMIFHQVQLIMCAWLSARYARDDHQEAVPS